MIRPGIAGAANFFFLGVVTSDHALLSRAVGPNSTAVHHFLGAVASHPFRLSTGYCRILLPRLRHTLFFLPSCISFGLPSL